MQEAYNSAQTLGEHGANLTESYGFTGLPVNTVGLMNFTAMQYNESASHQYKREYAKRLSEELKLLDDNNKAFLYTNFDEFANFHIPNSRDFNARERKRLDQMFTELEDDRNRVALAVWNENLKANTSEIHTLNTLLSSGIEANLNSK